MNIAKNLAVIPVREAIEEWEPRAAFKDITIKTDPSNPGKIIFTVQVEIKGRIFNIPIIRSEAGDAA